MGQNMRESKIELYRKVYCNLTGNSGTDCLEVRPLLNEDVDLDKLINLTEFQRHEFTVRDGIVVFIEGVYTQQYCKIYVEKNGCTIAVLVPNIMLSSPVVFPENSIFSMRSNRSVDIQLLGYTVEFRGRTICSNGYIPKPPKICHKCGKKE